MITISRLKQTHVIQVSTDRCESPSIVHIDFRVNWNYVAQMSIARFF